MGTLRLGLFCTVVLVLIAGCAHGDGSSDTPGPLTVIADPDAAADGSIEVDVGTYCSGNTCADTAEPDPADLLVLEVREGVPLTFDWEQPGASVELTLCRGVATGDCDIVKSDDQTLQEAWSLDVPPGRYRASAFVTWGGGNDASFDWTLRIREA